jgi:hypothetical protein
LARCEPRRQVRRRVSKDVSGARSGGWRAGRARSRPLPVEQVPSGRRQRTAVPDIGVHDPEAGIQAPIRLLSHGSTSEIPRGGARGGDGRGLTGATIVPPNAKALASCGVERWSVKTLSDPTAGEVRFVPRVSTVDFPRTRPDPHVGPGTPPLPGVERTTYRLSAQLVEFKREADNDIHLVIASPRSRFRTMIVEFPNPLICAGRPARPASRHPERPPIRHRGLRAAACQLLRTAARQRDDHRRGVLRRSPPAPTAGRCR